MLFLNAQASWGPKIVTFLNTQKYGKGQNREVISFYFVLKFVVYI